MSRCLLQVSQVSQLWLFLMSQFSERFVRVRCRTASAFLLSVLGVCRCSTEQSSHSHFPLIECATLQISSLPNRVTTRHCLRRVSDSFAGLRQSTQVRSRIPC